MKTPIVDFVSRYCASDAQRCHMPGHKGQSLLGCEPRDITEIDGADDLYHADGIIRESEENASALFGCDTLFATEGSSQCIRAMLFLILRYAVSLGKRPCIVAARNAHAVFVGTAALLDIDVEWVCDEQSYLSCCVKPTDIENAIKRYSPTAVYLTSPDYLGNIADVKAIADVCRRHGVLLIVDNAHGAYLKFLQPSQHPIDLGADICCDSAHKTLPSLTGGAYLHIAETAPPAFHKQPKQALAMFGTTSPSYLILQSLDAVNAYLDDGYAVRLAAFIDEVDALKRALTEHGYTLVGDEPLKVSIRAPSFGYRGDELSAALTERGVVCEFYDPDFVVLMLTPEIDTLEPVKSALLGIPGRTPFVSCPPRPHLAKRVMRSHEALFCDSETVSVDNAKGRVLAAVTVSCPPAVPVVMCGDEIDEQAIIAFRYYGIDTCDVVK